MISSLRGRLIAKDGRGVVVECSGVGFRANMPASLLDKIGEVGSDIFLFVYTHLSQDAIRLFGFLDEFERQTFEILISVSGIGPKLGLTILSELTPAELAEAVTRGDKATLTRISGIGQKTAARIIVELKDRLPEQISQGQSLPSGRTNILSDLIAALENLGFRPPSAEDVAKRTLSSAPDESDLATLVRSALQISVKP